MDKQKLIKILENHLHYIRRDCKGWENLRANLSEANLFMTNLSEANLCGANLSGATLRGADLSEANLFVANLSKADLSEANLREADLRGANLCGANLSEADLREADLRGADLSEANLRGTYIVNAYLNKIIPICCPESGSFIGWKKASKQIVKLQITEQALRSSATTRKCRCSEALVLAIENVDGTDSGLDSICSSRDSTFIYKIGELVKVDDFDMDRRNECSTGIHFFITRQEAVNYIV